MSKTLTIDDVRERMVSLGQLTTVLETTEPVQTLEFNVGQGTSFFVGENWNAQIEEKGDQSPVLATISVNGQELGLTKSSLLDCTSAFGMPRGLAQKTPGELLTPTLNYWLGDGEGLGERSFKVLRAGTKARAVTKSALVPFSNLRLLEAAVAGIQKKYGASAEIVADYKFTHGLHQTDFRLVVPEYVRSVDSAHATTESPDNWSVGLSIRNSLTGLGPTEISGYLFRYWCTNGAVDTKSINKWSRRTHNQDPETVYEWAAAGVDEVLGGLEHTLDQVAELPNVQLAGNLQQVQATLSDTFSRNRIPGVLQTEVLRNMADEADLSMYSVMQAITSVANLDDLDHVNVQRLLVAGGELASEHHDRCGNCHRVL